MDALSSFRDLSDGRLIEEVGRLALSERRATAALLASLAEFDRRRLHLARGYASLFEYCRRALCLSEHEALNRIEAARAIRRFPLLLVRLESGALSLTAVRLLAPHLTPDNCEALAAEAQGKTTEDVRRLIARMNPQPPVPSVIRKLPEPKTVVASPMSTGSPPESLDDLAGAPRPAPCQAPPSRRPLVAPLSDVHFKLQVTIGVAARERLAQIQALMRHRVPSGDPAAIVEYALEVLHGELLKQKAALVARPRASRRTSEPKGRSIPASVKRLVWRRDQGRCAFVAPDGRRCGSDHGVEFHHIQPFARGGPATVENIALRCRAHNAFQARLDGLGWQPASAT